MTAQTAPLKLGGRSGFGLLLTLAVVLLVFVASGVVSYFNTRSLSQAAQQVSHTHDVLSILDDILSMMKDAETGQRGFLIVGEVRYLEPHSAAVARIQERLEDVKRLTADNPNQQFLIPTLKSRIGVKLQELEETISLRRTQGFDAARAVVATDRGKAAMDEIRNQVAAMQQEERALLAHRLAETGDAYRVAVGSGVLTGAIGILLTGAVGFLIRRSTLAQERQEWLQTGQIGLSTAMVGDQSLGQLGERMLRFLAERLDAHAGAFYVKDGESFRRVAMYGAPATGGAPDGFVLGDGLLGQAAKDGRTFQVLDVPEGYLTVSSALGRGIPNQLMIVPVTEDNAVNGVLELGFLHSLHDAGPEFLEKVSESVGVAVRAAQYRAHLQDLLEETQRQAEELQSQSEELRVNNEELEEQSRALRESQAQLELQQSELEQSNVQLQEQSQLLEAQRDDVSRAKVALQTKAQELEQASQYKSDFLANMSHELRTPLNSSLILAKLLADNPLGNLSEEQVQYAETIQSSGNDLLALINDILDLSKIEAGHMEVRLEPVRIAQLADDLNRVFQPVAKQKGLTFRTTIAPDCPAIIETDRQRLEQVLKNLLSNAMKFTEQGEVALQVAPAASNRISFAVTDTGIGIPEHQRQLVFEAFRQADGTSNRKYGGTGLGLSISRELTKLLGGEIHLHSESGSGSTFTVTLPGVYDATLSKSRLQTAPADTYLKAAPAEDVPLSRGQYAPAIASAIHVARMEDDRERLTGDRRVILAVEDDLPFARIIFDLAHELDFQCLVASTAEEGAALALQYLPSALVLDVGLPDHSGLSVLDRLKHDARTRHIPIHVVSAGDYAQTALSLGAVGYLLKPVQREQLVDALKQLENRLAQRMRRVLVVEDDAVQRESLQKLLRSHDVTTVGAGTAAECLEQLKGGTFDCMVLDLSLPDATGHSLLETLSREDAYAFPPVIVYTGRDISAVEEQQLRKYSKSIIIKGAKSPERLLDEVTLFLHQVVADLPAEQQRMIEKARSRDAALEGRSVLVVEDDVRNVFALSSILEPRGVKLQIARNGREALAALERSFADPALAIDLVLMDVMMPEMDGITATREIRKRPDWKKLPIIMLTAKAMKDDQEQCLSAGANDYMAKPLDVEKLLSLVRVWMPR